MSWRVRRTIIRLYLWKIPVLVFPEELENIWERVYKVDKSRSRRGTGTGLGLSIVKKIIEMHGGKVSVESELDKGTIFTVYLPSTEQA